MRFHFANNRHPMAIATKLKSMFPELIPSLGLAQAVAAKIFGWGSWHEFSKSMKDGKEPVSPWDDEVSAEEATSRQLVMAGRLSEALPISMERATSSIGTLRPMARLSSAKTSSPGWREKLDDPAYATTLIGPEGRDDKDVIAEYRGDIGRKGNYLAELHHGGQTFELYLERSENHSEIRGLEGRSILSILVQSEKIVGVVSGALFKVRRPSTMGREEYVDLFDIVNDETCGMGLALIERREAHKLFETGRSSLFVSDYRVLKQALPKGTGDAYLKALADILVPLDKPIGSLVIEIDPQQYAEVDINNRLHDKSYRQAQANLEAYFRESRPERHFGEKCLFFSVTPRGSETGDSMADTLLSLGRAYSRPSSNFDMAKFHNLLEGAHPLLKDAFEFTARQSTAHLATSTRTHPDEPLPVSFTNPFPDGFNHHIAFLQKSLGPHKEFWKFMPTDLIQVTVTYKTALPDFDPNTFDGEILHRIDFRFRNGKQIELGPEELILGREGDKLPKTLSGASGLPLAKNPLTDRYDTQALAYVLKANSLLLFAGEGREVVWTPSEPVTYTRP
ncbi:hypothetical protein HFO56_03475 [Rhizobium laguerreae]|uniref:hypothetical protein n=1 Tax=Rhizobium laguerreae TaxID=1076926 RepID=UPI001C90DE12|nr:hypothetical protein [Rhizobium laguerreae]MBY3151449.1 hypothetical protein [Rhizobium laguerreae]